MKAAYVGIDFLYPALPALAEICEILKIFTCRTDNVTEFNTQVTAYARDHGVPLQTERVRLSDLEDLAAGRGLLHRVGEEDRLPLIQRHLRTEIHHRLLRGEEVLEEVRAAAMVLLQVVQVHLTR